MSSATALPGLISFRRMPRERYQRGFLRKVGVKLKQWEGLWYVYITEDGREVRKRRRKIIGPCAKFTKGKAQEELDRLIRENSAAHRELAPITVAEYCDRYRAMKESSWSLHNRTVMKSLFARHVIPKLGPLPLLVLTREVLQKHLDDLTATGLSYSILHKTRTHLKSMLDEAEDAGLVPKNVANRIKVPKGLSRTVQRPMLTAKECQRFLTAATGRDGLIVALAMIDGLRPSELFALRANDVEPGKLRIDEAVVQGKLCGTKTYASAGYVHLSKTVELQVRAHVRDCQLTDDAFLFTYANGNPLRQGNYVRRQLRTISKEAGLKPVTFQMLRRSFATHLQAHGGPKDIQGALRHSNPEFSMRTYVQILPEGVAGAVDAWADRLMGPHGFQRIDAVMMPSSNLSTGQIVVGAAGIEPATLSLEG